MAVAVEKVLILVFRSSDQRPLKTRAGLLNQDDPFDVKLVKMQLFDAQRDAAVVCTTPAAP